jgi:hypothetical protein
MFCKLVMSACAVYATRSSAKKPRFPFSAACILRLSNSMRAESETSKLLALAYDRFHQEDGFMRGSVIHKKREPE